MAEPDEYRNTDSGPSATPDAATSATPTAPATPVSCGRRAPDVLTLVVGLISLAVATMVAAGWMPELRLFDLRWALSGGAVVLGVLC